MNLQLVSKESKEFSQDNVLWKFHLKIHFPDYLKYFHSANQEVDYRKKFQILCTYEFNGLSPSWLDSDEIKLIFKNNKLPKQNEIKETVQKREFIYDISVLINLVEASRQLEKAHNLRFIFWCRYVKNRQDLLDYFYVCVENSNHGSQRIINQLIFSVLFNQETAVDSFIQDPSTNLEVVSSSGKTPLYVAAYAGHCNMVAKLLNAKANVDGRLQHHHTPLQAAARMGHANIVALLIERKANVNIDDKEVASNPLCDAADQGYVRTMSHLLEAKANPNRLDDALLSPLFLSVSRGQLPAVKLLLDHKADPDILCMGGKPYDGTPVEEIKRAILIARIEKHIDTLMNKIHKVPNLFSEKSNEKTKNEVEAARKLKELCMSGWHDTDEEAYKKYHKYWKSGLSELYKDACKLNIIRIPKRPNCTIM